MDAQSGEGVHAPPRVPPSFGTCPPVDAFVMLLEVEGILYPSQVASFRPTTVRHKCEEFDEDEIDMLVRQVVGIPVCVEHDMSTVVGRVKRARKTASNAVWVTFTVEEDTETGRDATRGVTDGSMCGLSLSHDYKYTRAEGADELPVSLDSWARRGDVAHKGPIELSLCTHPARAGCHVHTVKRSCGGGEVVGKVDACATTLEKRRGIHITGVVCASGMESAPPVANETPPPPGACDAELAARSEPAPPPDAPATDTQAPPGADSQAQPPRPDAAGGPDPGAESIEAMTRATELIRDSARVAQQAQSEAETLRAEREKLLAEQEALRTRVNEQQQAMERQVREHDAERQRAQTERHMQTLKCLQDTLTACGTPACSQSLTAAGAAGIDPAEQQRLITDTAVNMAATAEQTIKGLAQCSQLSRQQASECMLGEKRARTEASAAQERLSGIAHTLQNFGGDTVYRDMAPTPADASRPAKVAKHQDIAACMQAFQRENPSAVWRDYRNHFESLAGTVSASAARLGYAQEPHAGGAELSAQQLYPDMFADITRMNKGRMITGDETRALVDAMRQHDARPAGPFGPRR